MRTAVGALVQRKTSEASGKAVALDPISGGVTDVATGVPLGGGT